MYKNMTKLKKGMSNYVKKAGAPFVSYLKVLLGMFFTNKNVLAERECFHKKVPK